MFEPSKLLTLMAPQPDRVSRTGDEQQVQRRIGDPLLPAIGCDNVLYQLPAMIIACESKRDFRG